MKRTLSLLLALCLVFTLLPFGAAAEETPEEDYILIRDYFDLYDISMDMAGNYMLVNDIDLTAALDVGGDLYSAEGWVALGYSADKTKRVDFTGTIDGNGHSIRGLRCDGDGAGFVWSNKGTIQNLTIASGEIHASGARAGTIAVYNYGLIDNCHSYVNVTMEGEPDGAMQGGGITSGNYNSGIITHSSNRGNVLINDTTAREYCYRYAGGIAGFNYGTIDQVWNNGAISVTSKNWSGGTSSHDFHGALAGGIVGVTLSSNSGTANPLKVTNAYNTGAITATNASTNFYAYAIAGGIVGAYDPYNFKDAENRVFENCYSAGLSSATSGKSGYDYCGGICGYVGSGYVKDLVNCYYLNSNEQGVGNVTTDSCKSLSDGLMKRQNSFVGFDFETVWRMGTGGYLYPVIALHNHVLDHVDAVEATCSESGMMEHWVCTECGALFADPFGKQQVSEEALLIPAGHNYEEIIFEPTCTEEGYTVHRCKLCGSQYVDSYIAKLGHNLVTEDEVPPTCTEDGRTAGTYCSRCDYVVSGGEIIPATGHTWDEGRVTTEPTADEDGVMTYTCITCGAKRTEPILRKPVIKTQPASKTAAVGENVLFTVKATGSELTYQWQYKKDGSASWSNSTSTGCKTATLTVKATEARNGMQFRCVIKNAVGTATSSAATLTAITKPSITTQPASKTAYAGDNVTFTVKASSSKLTYQWQYKKAGATSWSNSTSKGNKTATLTVEATVARDGMQFRCVVKNIAGTATSSAATLTVLSAPSITTQPTSKTANTGDTVKFTVKATGSDLTYQWQYRKAGSSSWYKSTSTGSQTSTLTVEATTARHGMQFRCVIKNGLGTATSNAATLSVPTAPSITTQPVSKTANEGDTVKFTVKATGSDLTYQWQYRKAGSSTWYDSASKGNKTATLTVSATAARNGMQFRCVVKNDLGTATSRAVKLTVPSAPAITTQPTNKTASVGGTVKFTVKATGTDLTYQWQYKKAGSSTWYNSTSTGCDTATLTISATAARNGMQFRCIIKNDLGKVTSNAATLTVK